MVVLVAVQLLAVQLVVLVAVQLVVLVAVQLVVLVSMHRRHLSIHKTCKMACDCGLMQSKNQCTGCS